MQINESDLNESWVENGNPITQNILNKPTKKLVQLLGGLQDKDSVGTSEIDNNSVTRPKIANSQINTDKLQDSQVTVSKVESNQITSQKIQNNQVTESKINNGQVTGNKIQNDQVTETKINNSQVTENKIQNKAVTYQKIQDMPGSTILGRIETTAGAPQPISFSDLASLLSSGESSVGEDDGDLMKVPSFGIGQEYKLNVLRDDTGGSSQPSGVDYEYIYGDFKNIRSGFYSVHEGHSQNPFSKKQTLIVQKHQDGLSNLIIQNHESKGIKVQSTSQLDNSITWYDLGIVGEDPEDVVTNTALNAAINAIDFQSLAQDLGSQSNFDVGIEYDNVFQIPFQGIGFRMNTDKELEIIENSNNDDNKTLERTETGVHQILNQNPENVLHQAQTTLITQYNENKRQLLFLGVDNPKAAISSYDKTTDTYSTKHIQLLGTTGNDVRINSENEQKFFEKSNVKATYYQHTQNDVLSQDVVYSEIEDIKTNYIQTQNLVQDWQNQNSQTSNDVLSQDVVYSVIEDIKTNYIKTQNLIQDWQNQNSQTSNDVLSQDVIYQQLDQILTRLTDIEDRLDILENP